MAYMSEKVRASLYAEMDSSFGVAKTKHCVVDAEPPLAPRGIKKPTKRKGTNYPERWSLYHHRLNSLSLLPIRQIASSLRLALCPKPKVVMRPHCRRGLMPQQRGNIQMVRQRGRPMMPQLKKSSMAQPLAVLQPSANEGTGTFHSYISEHQFRGYDEGTIGWIFSVFIFLGFFGGIQIGPASGAARCSSDRVPRTGVSCLVWEFWMVLGWIYVGDKNHWLRRDLLMRGLRVILVSRGVPTENLDRRFCPA
ncbi:predicted protein [Histoplasma mississippiense (nom. inval.)]|uniref:predicted protein n=1 Tax=Ajellomyces capsulatus (strain NAm1 / WU24) TaxID=2059318 RepID=UPI000157BFC2|nr:predicted protein [Histoplasma mississippiense (nom. inval.)]EDN06398.1 predicted protein [Histoplasma mississippiense (nom. inval.)]